MLACDRDLGPHVEACDLVAAAPKLRGHISLSLADKANRLNVIRAVKFLDAVNMAGVTVKQVEAIIGHWSDP
jgi:hypothetical protein